LQTSTLKINFIAQSGNCQKLSKNKCTFCATDEMSYFWMSCDVLAKDCVRSKSIETQNFQLIFETVFLLILKKSSKASTSTRKSKIIYLRKKSWFCSNKALIYCLLKNTQLFSQSHSSSFLMCIGFRQSLCYSLTTVKGKLQKINRKTFESE
jgi:hypothetical protein